jgi:predicted metal-dependent phosphoesterase TrpH
MHRKQKILALFFMQLQLGFLDDFLMASPLYPIDRYGAVFDGHVHSCYDFHDGRLTPEMMVKLSQKCGFNWINAMSHDNVRGMARFKRCAKDANMPLIPAMEISTNFNHLLAYGVHEWPYAKDSWDPDIVIEHLRAQDCAIFISHPCVSPWRGMWTPEIVARLDVDGIEWNNSSLLSINKKTWRNFANCPPGRRIAGTDAHTPEMFGFAWTQVNINSKDPDDLVAAMKAGKCRPGGRYVPVHRVIYSAVRSLIRKGLNSPFPINEKYIPPQWYLYGLEPVHEQDPYSWKREIVKKPIKTAWALG